MEIYMVEYTRLSLAKYFRGDSYYFDTGREYFSTPERAQAFIDKPVYEFAGDHLGSVQTKRPNDGEIKTIEIDKNFQETP